MSKIIFSKPPVSASSMIKSLVNLMNGVLVLSALALFSFSLKYAGSAKPVVWVFLFIVSVRIMIVIIQKLKANVYHLEMDMSRIAIKYHRWNREEELVWPISQTKLDLLERRTAQGFFEGIEVQFKNEGKKLKLREDIWDYIDFETIYFEFKKIKNEPVPEDEADILKQLQIMNGTYKKDTVKASI